MLESRGNQWNPPWILFAMLKFWVMGILKFDHSLWTLNPFQLLFLFYLKWQMWRTFVTQTYIEINIHNLEKLCYYKYYDLNIKDAKGNLKIWLHAFICIFMRKLFEYIHSYKWKCIVTELLHYILSLINLVYTLYLKQILTIPIHKI